MSESQVPARDPQPGELHDEEFVLLGVAVRRFPELRGWARTQLLNRWATRGVAGSVLESDMRGGRRYICRAGVRKFLKALNGPTKSRPPCAATRAWVRKGLAEARL